MVLHAAAVFTFWSRGARGPPQFEAQFVSLWSDERPIPEAAPAEGTALRIERSMPPPASPSLARMPTAQESRPGAAIDWYREGAAIARGIDTDRKPLSFSEPAAALRTPCIPKDSIWFAERKPVDLPVGAVPIGKHCYAAGTSVQCVARLGKVETPTAELLAALREEGRSSVPDPEENCASPVE